MEIDPDRALLEAWKNGDKQAGDQLVRRHFGSVRAFFRTMAPDRDHEDLIQSTFLGCVNSIDKFRGDSLFRTYLFQVARNTLADYFRKNGKILDQTGLSNISVADTDPTPPSILVKRGEEKALVHALRMIPVDDQIVLVLYYWHELPAREIGDVYELPEGTVRGRIARAMDALRRALRRMEIIPQELQSTLDNLESWLKEIRAKL